MKIVIIGAGAMGSLYGAMLSKKNEVIMIDSYEPQVDAINKNGITIMRDEKEFNFPNVKAYLSGSYTGKADIIIVFVKSTFTQNALEQNKELFTEDTIVMTLQNGAGNDKKIARYVKPEQVIVGTSRHNAVNLGAGKINHPGNGATTIGSNHEEGKERVAIVETVLKDSGFEVVVSDDIQRIIWSKLLVNLSVNTLTAITETPIGYMIKDKHAWDFARRLIYEAVDVAEADGTYFDRREALEIVRNVCVDVGDGYSSMYQDRKRHVKMEIDAINGAIVEQAKIYGVPTPYNAIIVDLIHAIEGAYDLESK